jgi:hypothetical protein
MSKTRSHHRSSALFPPSGPINLLRESFPGRRSSERILASFHLQTCMWEMFPLLSPVSVLTVHKVRPEEVLYGDLILYRSKDFGGLRWRIGFAEVQERAVHLLTLEPFERSTYDRYEGMPGSRSLRKDEIFLKVVEVRTPGEYLHLDRFRRHAGLMMLASGIGTGKEKRS